MRHFLPPNINLRFLSFRGTPAYTDVWSEDDNRYYRRFVADFTIMTPMLSITIHQGFTCDGASVPKRFWDSIGSPYASRYLFAAILHDALYASELLSREICDELFVEAMKALGVAWWRRNAMYLAVKFGGGKVWRQHTPESIGETRKLLTVNWCNY